MICFIPISCFALVQPSKVLYVTDDAEVLKKETEDYIVLYSDYLNRTEKIHYYVVTVQNLEKSDLDTYANFVYDSFDIGENGLLVFFTKEERMIKVIVGEEVSLFIDSDDINRVIQDYFMPFFKNDDWDDGIKNGYSAFYKMICDYYDIDSSPMQVDDGSDIIVKYRYPLIAFLTFLGSLTCYVFCRNMKRGRRKKGFKHFFVFGFCVLVNILLILAGYYVEPVSIILILGSEFIMYSSFFNKNSSMTLSEAARQYEIDHRRKRIKHKKKLNSKRKQF